MCETRSELTIKTPERRQWHRSGVFIVNFEQISQIFLVFLLLTLSKLMLAGEKLIKELFLYPLKTHEMVEGFLQIIFLKILRKGKK